MHVLFVCTGNICRSPFAEALGPVTNPEHSYASAGTHAIDGVPASGPGVEVAAKHFELELGDHRAAQLTPALLEEADLVYAMEESNVDDILRLAPTARVELLSPDGGPVPDPYGGDEGSYLVSYSLIKRAVGLRLGPDAHQEQSGKTPYADREEAD